MENCAKTIMPALFLGHGSPMNAIEDNVFTAGFRQVAKDLPIPKAILCISAHWETRGTWSPPWHIQDDTRLRRISSATLRDRISCSWQSGSGKTGARDNQIYPMEMNDDWGLDHGCWSVVKFLYPEANVPIVELSIDYTRPASYHYALAKELASLRSKGIMIIASGNIVHNPEKD